MSKYLKLKTIKNLIHFFLIYLIKQSNYIFFILKYKKYIDIISINLLLLLLFSFIKIIIIYNILLIMLVYINVYFWYQLFVREKSNGVLKSFGFLKPCYFLQNILYSSTIVMFIKNSYFLVFVMFKIFFNFISTVIFYGYFLFLLFSYLNVFYLEMNNNGYFSLLTSLIYSFSLINNSVEFFFVTFLLSILGFFFVKSRFLNHYNWISTFLFLVTGFKMIGLFISNKLVYFSSFFCFNSLSFILFCLIIFMYPLIIYSGNSDVMGFGNNLYSRLWLVLLSLTLFFLSLAFAANHIILFFFAYEASMVPLLFMLGLWGSRNRKLLAIWYLVLFTMLGSLPLLIGLLFFIDIYNVLLSSAFCYEYGLYSIRFFIFFFLIWGFSFKIPVVPFHLWLPEAHVEGPATTSIILAAILMKLGGYGFIRFIYFYFPDIFACYSYIFLVIFIFSIIFSNFVALRQTDIKRIIAYSSIGHMNMAVLGLFYGGLPGFLGMVYMLLGHAFISGALFFIVGILYTRYGVRHVGYFGGLFIFYPKISFFFFIFSLGNISFPGTWNFISEYLVLQGLVAYSKIITFLILIVTIICTGFTLLLYNRIFSGSFSEYFFYKKYSLQFGELFFLFFLFFFILYFGLQPDIIFKLLFLDGALKEEVRIFFIYSVVQI